MSLMCKDKWSLSCLFYRIICQWTCKADKKNSYMKSDIAEKHYLGLRREKENMKKNLV